MAFSTDLKRKFHDISIIERENRSEIKKKVAEFVELHTDTKKLSDKLCFQLKFKLLTLNHFSVLHRN